MTTPIDMKDPYYRLTPSPSDEPEFVEFLINYAADELAKEALNQLMLIVCQVSAEHITQQAKRFASTAAYSSK